MSTTATSRWDRVHDSRDAFSSVLWAMCNPGRAHGPLPGAGLVRDVGVDAAAGLLLALLDPGVSLADDGRPSSAAVAAAVRAATDADAAPVEAADLVLVVGPPGDLDVPVASRARRGTRFQPELGATIVYVGTGATSTVELTGPGIDGHLATQVGLDERELAARSAIGERDGEPGGHAHDRDAATGHGLLGVEVVIVGDDGTVVALPRTTRCRVRGG